MLENVNNSINNTLPLQQNVISNQNTIAVNSFSQTVSTIKEETSVQPVSETFEEVKKEEKNKSKMPNEKNENVMSVVYSLKSGNIPGFGEIKKGYSKIEKKQAKNLVEKYSFIRFASKEEIETYVN